MIMKINHAHFQTVRKLKNYLISEHHFITPVNEVYPKRYSHILDGEDLDLGTWVIMPRVLDKTVASRQVDFDNLFTF